VFVCVYIVYDCERNREGGGERKKEGKIEEDGIHIGRV